LEIEETMSATQTQKDDKAVALTRYAWLSISAALITIVLKTIAYLLTDSVGLLSDAMESIVNLVGAIIALSMLIIAARPPDDSHTYGHSKAEYFASSAEGILILIAAGGILWTAIERLISPHPLEKLGVGLTVSVGASLVNLVVARILITTGKKRNSITLEADGQHLMTDVWTSVGVIGGIAIVAVTNWYILDPILAILVALNIIWTGIKLLQRSVAGFMDASLPANEQQIVEKVIAIYQERGVKFHAVRTRQSAARRFVSVHMLVPGEWTVHDAHHVAEDFEGDVRSQLKDAIVHTHLEPMDDEISVIDIHDI
jgi:cation diffusion facilitator family transporter